MKYPTTLMGKNSKGKILCKYSMVGVPFGYEWGRVTFESILL